ncbi:AzlD domain-containing protein [Ramlibacter humi]|uniref:AzlD domain-containing protein n=1 Tax=Ramlibacter humi TaxID=2530451 RepID=UPI001EF06A72|nr:AzlD domain-containing protein [Ramlibacter humi]
MSRFEIFFTILGMAAVTLLCRSFFLLPDRELPLPRWLEDCLRYAPAAALLAVVVPEIVMHDGQLVTTWRDAHVGGALAGLAVYALRRRLLATILGGTAAMLALRFGLGW